ncbi:hypothetical protein PsYK624_045560 [Phanerochaete sordida]|uniref:Uncharacterized protein n=1 Tax=Phanerochaete sordida TaxID=48140 RepID=A0A9P3G3K2_9APHY|nr:hypothetical protein PsYK624_045560 [Phanerochaete sordida]
MEDTSPTAVARPQRAVTRRATQTLTILTVQCLDRSLGDQIDLSAIVRDPRVQFPLEGDLWGAIDRVIRVFFPITTAPAVRTDYNGNGVVYKMQMDGEGVRILFGVKLERSKEEPNQLARLTLQMDGQAYHRRDGVRWAELEDALQNLLHVPSIGITIFGETDTTKKRLVEWLLESVSRGRIFTNMDVMKKLEISYWPEENQDYVVSSLSSLIM